MAGGELRLGTVATYMLTWYRNYSHNTSRNLQLYMLTKPRRNYLNPLGTKDFL